MTEPVLKPYIALIDSWDVYDGDSVHAELDVGYGIKLEYMLRLRGVDTPEIRSRNPLEKEVGRLVADRVSNWMQHRAAFGQFYFLSTDKPKYHGRAVGIIYDAQGEVLNDFVLNKGFGKLYEGGAREGWTEEQLLQVKAKAK